jgi:hypothetical protein
LSQLQTPACSIIKSIDTHVSAGSVFEIEVNFQAGMQVAKGISNHEIPPGATRKD